MLQPITLTLRDQSVQLCFFCLLHFPESVCSNTQSCSWQRCSNTALLPYAYPCRCLFHFQRPSHGHFFFPFCFFALLRCGRYNRVSRAKVVCIAKHGFLEFFFVFFGWVSFWGCYTWREIFCYGCSKIRLVVPRFLFFCFFFTKLNHFQQADSLLFSVLSCLMTWLLRLAWSHRCCSVRLTCSADIPHSCLIANPLSVHTSAESWLLNTEMTAHFLTRWIVLPLPPCSRPRPPRSDSTSCPTSRRRTSCTSSLNTSAAQTAWPTRTDGPQRSYGRGLGVSGTWCSLCWVFCWRMLSWSWIF